MSLSICIAQLNPVVGDLQGNAQKAITAAQQAFDNGHQLLVFSELFICGYAAEDLFLRPTFLADCHTALHELVQASGQWPGLHIVIGHPLATAGRPAPERPIADSDFTPVAWNAASVITSGHITHTYRKHALPNYGVFDEKRYFAAHHQACVFEMQGIAIGLLICEDAWVAEPALQAVDAGAQMLVVLNASPYAAGKVQHREAVLRARALQTQIPLIYAHAIGGQDDLVFDGHSFAVDADGHCVGHAPGFEEALWPVQVERIGDTAGLALRTPANYPVQTPSHQLWSALVLATGDYVRKSGFQQVVLGLSGGIDSALVMAIAVDALGAKNVRAVMMPSPYTASISLEDAREMAHRLHVQYDELSIAQTFEGFKESLQPVFGERAQDTTEENIQARIRGVLLMAISNKFGSMVLTTGNKSELAMGYCTLYGDMCGGFAPLKDVYKTQAFELAWWRNQHAFNGGVANPIPERIITRPPSAELRPDQTDQDSLPPYEVLDAILRLRIEGEQSAQSIEAAGFAPERVAQVLRLLRINEYKRRQGAPGPKLSSRNLSKDWRYPIANRYRG